MVELQNFCIREAQLQDAAQIQQSIFPSRSIAQIRKRIKTLSKRKKRIVAEINGKIIGYAVLSFRTAPHAHTALLHSLFVKEELRNKGIGKKIISFAENLALQNNVEILLLETRAENKSAMNLYRELGFEQYGFLKNGYKKSNIYKDVALMGKILGE